MDYKIKSIQKEDNVALNNIIKEMLINLDCLNHEYLKNAELDDIYSQYSQEKSNYWTIAESKTNEIVGGAGYAPLKDSLKKEKICELQKMYISPKAQGKGLAKILLKKILENAKKDGYTKVYLETMNQLKKATNFYTKNGFKLLSSPLGNTGHKCCTIYMELDL